MTMRSVDTLKTPEDFIFCSSNVIFQLCEHHKQKSIQLHYSEVSGTNLSVVTPETPPTSDDVGVTSRQYFILKRFTSQKAGNRRFKPAHTEEETDPGVLLLDSSACSQIL